MGSPDKGDKTPLDLDSPEKNELWECLKAQLNVATNDGDTTRGIEILKECFDNRIMHPVIDLMRSGGGPATQVYYFLRDAGLLLWFIGKNPKVDWGWEGQRWMVKRLIPEHSYPRYKIFPEKREIGISASVIEAALAETRSEGLANIASGRSGFRAKRLEFDREDLAEESVESSDESNPVKADPTVVSNKKKRGFFEGRRIRSAFPNERDRDLLEKRNLMDLAMTFWQLFKKRFRINLSSDQITSFIDQGVCTPEFAAKLVDSFYDEEDVNQKIDNCLNWLTSLSVGIHYLDQFESGELYYLRQVPDDTGIDINRVIQGALTRKAKERGFMVGPRFVDELQVWGSNAQPDDYRTQACDFENPVGHPVREGLWRGRKK